MSNSTDLKNGLFAQHNVAEYLRLWYGNKYYVFESEEGSSSDMEDKIDITLISKKTDRRYYYDVKSTLSSDRITYTYINKLKQPSKIYSGNFTIHPIFVFNSRENVFDPQYGMEVYGMYADKFYNKILKPFAKPNDPRQFGMEKMNVGGKAVPMCDDDGNIIRNNSRFISISYETIKKFATRIPK